MPEDARKPNLLDACHAEVSQIVGEEMEPVEVIRRLEEYRGYWRPGKVRLLLLAESHVYTAAEELTRSVRFLPGMPADLPRGFVKLVQCLGYGEDLLLDRPLGRMNSGTPPFWKILYSCVYPTHSSDDFAPVLATRTRVLDDRISNKLAVLQALKNKGVWLLDAGVAALYRTGSPKPAPGVYRRVLEASWQGHTRSVIEAANPEAILCIGRGVEKALASRLNALGIDWAAVPQPGARLPSHQHARIFDSYYRAAEDPRYVRQLPGDLTR